MSESLGHRDDRDAMAERLGGHEVPQVVQPEAADAGTAEMTDELLGHPVRQPRHRPVTRCGEHKRAVGEGDAARSGASVGSLGATAA